MDFKKVILPVALIVILGIFIVYKQFFGTSNNPTSTPIVSNDENSPTPIPSLTSLTTPKATTVVKSGYKNGQFTGQVASTIFGDVQVRAIIVGGKITDIQFLKFPDSPGHTTDVSHVAGPALKTEAIAAQSSKVNIISGATQTSEGFQQSLASALAQAI